MCGIVGILHRDGAPVSTKHLGAMIEAVAHRGPDGEGMFHHGPIGLGHRRLAIMDVSDKAAQPMAFEGFPYALSFSGEVYNFQDIKRELEAQGVFFASSGDTEVVFHALAKWGAEAVSKFKGMFAIAWVDLEKRELVLARDRFGIKPLYIADAGNTILFASEIKSILSHPAFQAQLNLDALSTYLAFQNTFSNETFFKGIQELQPGVCRRIPFEDGKYVTEVEFGSFDFETECTLAMDETLARFEDLLGQAIQRQLMGEKTPAVYLSGGLDSSIIAALASQSDQNIPAVSIGFDTDRAEAFERDADETDIAISIARTLGLDHHLVRMDAQQTERALQEIVFHMETPKMGQSYANIAASKLAKGQSDTVLSGLGGDELLGGYPWRYDGALSAANTNDLNGHLHRYWHGVCTPQEREQLLQPIWSDVQHIETYEAVRANATALEDHEGPGRGFRAWRAFEFKTFLRGLLSVDDKLGMANSVETRFPFLDDDLVDFMLSVPVEHLLPISQKTIGNHEGKTVLRRLVAKHLPKAISERRKRGFTGPNNSWYRTDGGTYLRSELLDRSAELYRFMDYDTVSACVEEHISGRANRHRLIWSLLSVKQWCRAFL